MRHVNPDSGSSTNRSWQAAGFLVRVHVVRLDAAPEHVAASFSLLSASERERAMRFHRAADRRRFVVARGRLRKLLGIELHCDPSTLGLRTGPYGKPQLDREFAHTDLQFNVSHSHDLCVIAFTRGRQLGVDVEIIRALPEMSELVAQNFSASEQAEYATLSPESRIIGFFNGWVRKEALLKAWGCGLNRRLDDFDVSLTPGLPAEIRRVGTRAGIDCGWQLRELPLLPGAVAAIAIEVRSEQSGLQLDITGL